MGEPVPAVITGPGQVLFDYSADLDGGSFVYLLDIPTGTCPPLRLAGLQQPMAVVTAYGTLGPDAALMILDGAVAEASAMLNALTQVVARER